MRARHRPTRENAAHADRQRPAQIDTGRRGATNAQRVHQRHAQGWRDRAPRDAQLSWAAFGPRLGRVWAAPDPQMLKVGHKRPKTFVACRHHSKRLEVARNSPLRPFKAVARVQIPLGPPIKEQSSLCSGARRCSKQSAPTFQSGGTGYTLVRANTAQEQVSVHNGDPFDTRMRTIIYARANAV